MKRLAIAAMTVCLLLWGANYALAAESNTDALFETPVECVKNFVDCLKRGDIEGMIAGMAVNTTAETLDVAGKAMRSGIRQTLDDGYEGLTKKVMAGDRVNEIMMLLQSLLIPADWAVKDMIIYSNRTIYVSDQDDTLYYYDDEGNIIQTEITIEDYYDCMDMENLSSVEMMEIIQISYDHAAEGLREIIDRNWNRVREKDYAAHIDDQMDVFVTVKYCGEAYVLCLTLYHFTDRGWAVKQYNLAGFGFAANNTVTWLKDELLKEMMIEFDERGIELKLLEDISTSDEGLLELINGGEKE